MPRFVSAARHVFSSPRGTLESTALMDPELRDKGEELLKRIVHLRDCL